MLKLIKATPARQITQGQVRKHNSGVYVTDIPYDPINQCAAIEYEEAENLEIIKTSNITILYYIIM